MQHLSSRELLQGIVQRIQENETMVEVTVSLPEGKNFTAVITSSAASSLKLEIGRPFFRSTKALSMES